MKRIFATKSFIFSNGEDEVKVKNHDWTEVPDWVTKTQLFKLAEIDGNIQIVQGKSEEKAIEETGTTEKQAKKKEEKQLKEEKEKSSADKE